MNECKIAVVGVGGSGRTSIIHRYVYDRFIEDYYEPYIEDNFRKRIQYNGEDCYLEIIDAYGSDDFMALFDLVIRAANSIILVFSLTNRESFNEIRNYYNRILRIKDVDIFPCVIVGNKVDLYESRAVSNDEIQNLASEIHSIYFETSAKENINIERIFLESYQIWLSNRVPQNSQISTDYNLCGFNIFPSKCKII